MPIVTYQGENPQITYSSAFSNLC